MFPDESCDFEQYCDECRSYIDTPLTEDGYADILERMQYDMWVKGEGYTPELVEAVALSLGMCTDNVRMIGRAVHFRLIPESSRSKYSRRTGTGRRVRACCYHGFRDFGREIFKLGATELGSSVAAIAGASERSSKRRWYKSEDFERDLPELSHINIGSVYHPVDMFHACECEDREISGIDVPSPMDLADFLKLDSAEYIIRHERYAHPECDCSYRVWGDALTVSTYVRRARGSDDRQRTLIDCTVWANGTIRVVHRRFWRNSGSELTRIVSCRLAPGIARVLLAHSLPKWVRLPELVPDTSECCPDGPYSSLPERQMVPQWTA